MRLQRIARRLLAEGKASNYDEAEVAASLLALKFGDVEALQAAKECSSVESALAFLQQECELCTGRFAMSQVKCIRFNPRGAAPGERIISDGVDAEVRASMLQRMREKLLHHSDQRQKHHRRGLPVLQGT